MTVPDSLRSLKMATFFPNCQTVMNQLIFLVSHRKLYSTWQWQQKLVWAAIKAVSGWISKQFSSYLCYLYWEMALNKCYQPPSTWCDINAGLSVLWKVWQWKQRKLRSHEALYIPRTVWGKMAGERRERQAQILLLSKATALITTMCGKILMLQPTNWIKLIKLAKRTATEKFRRTSELAWSNSYTPPTSWGQFKNRNSLHF